MVKLFLVPLMSHQEVASTITVTAFDGVSTGNGTTYKVLTLSNDALSALSTSAGFVSCI
jgi:autotransporter adhesin